MGRTSQPDPDSPRDPSGNMPDEQTVAGLWARRVRDQPARLFLFDDHDNRPYSYGEFDVIVRSMCDVLAEEGIEDGTRLGLLLPNLPATVAIQFAAATIGAILVPLIPGSTRPELAHVVGNAEVEVAIASSGEEQALRGLVRCLDVARIWEQALLRPHRGSLAGGTLSRRSPFAIFHTSGSTGSPKGAVIPHGGYVSAGRGVAHRLDLRASDNLLLSLPLFHAGGTIMVLGAAIAAGASLTLIPKFSASDFWRVIRERDVTACLLMPTMMEVLQRGDSSSDDRLHPLRVVWSHRLNDGFAERFGVHVCAVWGQTETSAMGTLTRPVGSKASTDPNFVGWPFPEAAEVLIAGPGGDTMPEGEVGELWFRHPDTMLGYYGAPEATNETVVDGWIRSGDLCSKGPDGGVTFHGRLKNMIKRSGENIACEEVENVLATHPSVDSVLVFGVADPVRDEEVLALIVPARVEDWNPKEVVHTATDSLSSWKLPRYIQVMSQPFPLLPNGKVDRVEARRLIDLTIAWDRSLED